MCVSGRRTGVLVLLRLAAVVAVGLTPRLGRADSTWSDSPEFVVDTTEGVNLADFSWADSDLFYVNTTAGVSAWGDSGVFTVDNRGGTDLDLFVQSMEMSQAIQDGTMPMVADRPTFLRVTVDWTGPPAQVTGVNAHLTVTVDGSSIAGSPFDSLNGPITAPSSPDLNNENDTLNFRFVAPQSDDVDLTVELNPAGAGRIPETNYGNNAFVVADQSFECRLAMTIQYVPIDYRFGQPPGSPPNLPDATMIAPGNAERFVRGIYPSPDFGYAAAPGQVWAQDINAPGQAAACLRDLEVTRQAIAPRPDFLYAWLPGNPYNGNGCAGGIPSRVAFGNTAQTRFLRTFAHELGHCFGLFHPGQGAPDGDTLTGHVGLDVDDLLGLGRIKAATLFGIMEPGRLTHEAWVDPTSYQFFLDAAVLDCTPKRGDEPVLLVTGLFDPVAITATIDPVREFPNGELSSADPAGNLILRAYHVNAGEELIYEVRFTAIGVDCPTEDPCVAPIVVSIPVMPGDPPQQVDRIDILLAATSEVLAQRWRSQSPPEIAVLIPSPGEELFDGMEITWTGSDPDSDPIHYGMAYSWDGGQSWIPLTPDTTETSATLDAGYLPGSNPGEARLRLTATDGLNTVSYDVDDLTLDAKKPPSVAIVTPAEGAVELEGAPVALTASVHDPEDGELPAGSVAWFSDVEGFLGTGTSLSIASLSIGLHELSVTVTDSDDMVDTDAVIIEIVARPAGSIPGDFNHDGLVDLADFMNLARCLGGPENQPAVGCAPDFDTDLDSDADVDLADFAVFQSAFTG